MSSFPSGLNPINNLDACAGHAADAVEDPRLRRYVQVSSQIIKQLFLALVNPPSADRLVAVTADDTTPDELDDKLSVLRGLTKAVANAGGDEDLEIGLPTGSNGDVLYFNGVNWIVRNIGTTGQVFTVVGGVPVWSTATGIGPSGNGRITDYYFVDMDTTTVINDTIDNAAAVDKGGGNVGIPVTGHGFGNTDIVTIAGTTNYNGDFPIVSQTTNEVVIEATFVSETFAGN